MSETHKAILEKANAAIAQGDHEGFLAFCTDDTKWTFVGDRTLEGKQAVREWMATAYLEPPRFEVHRLIADGDFLAALGEITLKDETGKATPMRTAMSGAFAMAGWPSCRPSSSKPARRRRADGRLSPRVRRRKPVQQHDPVL